MLVNRVHKPYICRICGNASGIKICKCQKAYYCSKNCQKIDWKSHKSDCYKLVDHPSASKNFPNNSLITSNKAATQTAVQQHQQFCEPSQSQVEGERRQQYDPTPFQYQQATNTSTPTQSTTIDDFEENLFNSLMFSVDESTEKEILKNLNIRADELLNVCNLVTDNSSSLDEQAFTATDDQLFDEKIFEQIQETENFEYKPETQQLLKETRENLEKELSLFREINLHEPLEQLDDDSSESDIMQISQTNPKYINHARLDDHLLYKWDQEKFLKFQSYWRVLIFREIDDLYGLEEMCSNLVRDMNEYGVCVLDNFIGEERGVKVLQEVKSMYSAGYFKVRWKFQFPPFKTN